MSEIDFIQDLKRQWLAMIDAIIDPLVLIDNEYNIIRQNKTYFHTILETSIKDISELKGKKCYEVFAQKTSPCEHCQVHKLDREKEDLDWTTNNLFPDKEYEIRAHYLLPENGDKDFRVVVHYRDITELKNLQKSLSHADKLAAIGKLAGGVAHEINSPLAGILAFTQIMLSEIDDDNAHKEDLEQIESSARKCKEIVENLLNFARQDKVIEVKNPVHVLFELRKTLKLAGGILRKKHINVTLNIPEGGDEFDLVIGNAGQIGQVFLNLITNAMHAMESGGDLEIDSYNEDNFICIAIKDSGSGIPPDIIHKIFDPFFTTKTIGEGTGLGLSISYSIAKQHGGDLTVSSVLKKGSTFWVRLPLAQPPVNS